MIRIFFIVALIIVVNSCSLPFGLPMSISCEGASYDIKDSKKKKLFLWEYEITYKKQDSIPFKLQDAYCEKQHFWKMNQIYYMPKLYEDKSRVQIRINSFDRGKWNVYEIIDFHSNNPIGICKKVMRNYLTDTLYLDIINKTDSTNVGEIILIKK